MSSHDPLSLSAALDAASQPPAVAVRDSSSDPISSPVHVSQASSRHPSRTPSPLLYSHPPSPQPKHSAERRHPRRPRPRGYDQVADDDDDDNPLDGDDPLAADDDDDEQGMPSDLRPPPRHADGKSYTPLLGPKGEPHYDSPVRSEPFRRRSDFRSRSPDRAAKAATRKRYGYAAFFLVLSLISFTVQTETAVYIQHNLGWKKAYCMLYATHGSWTMLWFLQLLVLRVQKWRMPWPVFWRRHLQLIYSTAQIVEHQDMHAPSRYPNRSPVPYMLRTTALVTCALTIAGGSWYVAVDMTTASDLTAIYNCSAFFAYAFSIPMLHEKLRWSKVVAVAVAIFGVLVVAYGDSTPAKHGSKSGGGTGGEGSSGDRDDASNRALGNIVIGIGSVLYGFYEVLYKKWACPPDGTSPGRSMIFANLFGSLIGSFTLLVLWIPLPILHFLNIERFEIPHGEQAWMLAISVFANAVFSGSFLVLISLTSPVLSSVAALLTIFLVAVVDQLLPPPLNSPLSTAAVVGGCLIIGAFLLLAFATFKEMDEERRKKAEDEIESDIDDD